MAYTLIRNPSLVPLTATSLQKTRSARNVDHGSSSVKNGSNLLRSNSIPSCDVEDVCDTIERHTCNDSKSTAQNPLVITASGSRIESPSEVTIDYQNTEGYCKLESESDVRSLTADSAKEESCKVECEPKLALKVETGQSESSGSKSGLTNSENTEQSMPSKIESGSTGH